MMRTVSDGENNGKGILRNMKQNRICKIIVKGSQILNTAVSTLQGDEPSYIHIKNIVEQILRIARRVDLVTSPEVRLFHRSNSLSAEIVSSHRDNTWEGNIWSAMNIRIYVLVYACHNDLSQYDMHSISWMAAKTLEKSIASQILPTSSR